MTELRYVILSLEIDKARVMKKISKLLIANRAEIALRIQKACHSLGIRTVSIASEADKTSLFARKAEELVVIGPSPAKDSYLKIEKIIETAVKHGCDAVHPGYGFLSENAEFAQRVTKAGLVFVGPTPAAIEVFGNKVKARNKVSEAGVPCVPGSKTSGDDKAILSQAQDIGFPVIIKAAAGGGGRGMRIAKDLNELREALPRARAEALKFFSSDAVFIERYIQNPRHVEVQIFGDQHGNIIHLGTRDCSVQRRHQKLIEEAPAPNLSTKLRDRIHEAAVNAGKSVGYSNAGTVEFLVSGEEFYFLEVNTRIQVEHPVTEVVTGLDLVALQLRVAMGEKLPFKQKDVKFRGHAIEYRIYAEDPRNRFAPAVGKISEIIRYNAPFVREDYGFESGDEVSPYYDAMLSKLIIWGPDRDRAINRSIWALKDYKVTGLPSTVDFHRWLLCGNKFRAGEIDIGYLDKEFKGTELDEISFETESSSNSKFPQDSSVIDPKTGKEVAVTVDYKNGAYLASIKGCSKENAKSFASNTASGAIEALIKS